MTATTAAQGLLRGVYGFVKAEGISGIYRGLFATVCKSASNQALRFVIFGEYKRLVWGSRPAHEMPPYVALGGGMVAGALGSVITMPFDVLKTKMQGLNANRRRLHRTLHHTLHRTLHRTRHRTLHRTLHSTRTAHAWRMHGACMAHAWCVPFGLRVTTPHPTPTRYTSTLHCLKTIVREEGVLVLYSGLGARLGRAAPRRVEHRRKGRPCSPWRGFPHRARRAHARLLGLQLGPESQGALALPRVFAFRSRVVPLSCDCCEQVPGQGIIFASYEVFSRFVTSSLSCLPFSGPPKKGEGR